MNGHVVVDASVWVARLLPQDVFHLPSRTWMEAQRARDVTLLSPSLLLAEVGGSVSRRTGQPALARRTLRSLQELPGLRLVEMDHRLAQAAADLASDLGIRGADAFYVALAARLQVPLATLDEDQKARAASLVSLQSIDAPNTAYPHPEY